MINKLKLLILALTSLFVMSATPAFAATNSGTKCGDTKTQFIACDSKTGLGTIGDLIKISLLVLTVLIGVVATGGLAYAGVIYAAARDEQSKISEAKTIIRNVIIGLVLYGFTVAIINWLVPGSVFDTSTPATQTPGAGQPTQSGTTSTP
jgi:hypothetical protein